MSHQTYLSIEQGMDYINVDKAQLPYVHVRVLGQGKSGFVEEVEDRLTKKVYARKEIPIVRYKQEERANVFQNELKTIRGLQSHHHIISVFATYVTTRSFGLILQPVASDGDLQSFLGTYWTLVEEMRRTDILDVRLASMKHVLQCAFGCLAAGLAFMHKEKIRHKDVKPGNILVHQGAVIYTDFGYSFDFNGFSRSTTEGKPKYWTPRYCSPELSEYEPRNSKSDVYSLGCVFIEILSALNLDRSLDAGADRCFQTSMDFLHTRLSLIEVPSIPAVLTGTIKHMTKRKPSKRLCSIHAAEIILQWPGFCCLECTRSPIETWKARVMKDECYFLLDESVDEYEWVSR